MLPHSKLLSRDQEVNLGERRITAERHLVTALGSTPAGKAAADAALNRSQSKLYFSALGAPENPQWVAAGQALAALEAVGRKHRIEGIEALARMASGEQPCSMELLGATYRQSPCQAGAFLKEARAAQLEIAVICRRFAETNVGLIVMVMGRHCGREERNANREDLQQEGMIALMRAAETWDSRRGFGFGTYAVWWVRQGLRRYLNTTQQLSTPVNRLEDSRAVSRVWSRRRIEGSHATEGDLSALTGITPERVRSAIGLLTQDIVSLSDPADRHKRFDVESTLISEEDVEAEVIRKDLATKTVKQLCSALTAIEETVIRERFGLTGRKKTLQEIGDLIGFSRERVRQIEGVALGKLRVKASRTENAGART